MHRRGLQRRRRYLWSRPRSMTFQTVDWHRHPYYYVFVDFTAIAVIVIELLRRVMVGHFTFGVYCEVGMNFLICAFVQHQLVVSSWLAPLCAMVGSSVSTKPNDDFVTWAPEVYLACSLGQIPHQTSDFKPCLWMRNPSPSPSYSQ